MSKRAKKQPNAASVDHACRRAAELWLRIRTRLELSSVWRFAPKEVIATEFLSLLRFALSPRTVEAALYELRGEARVPLIGTLPPSLFRDSTSNECEHDVGFDTERFFEKGSKGVPPQSDRELDPTTDAYFKHARSFDGAPFVYRVSEGVSGVELRLLVREELDEVDNAHIRLFLEEAGLPHLLEGRDSGPGHFHGEWRPLAHRLGRDFMGDILDRLETDLAIVTGLNPPDIWILLKDESDDGPGCLHFHASSVKLARLLDYYRALDVESEVPGTLSALNTRFDDGLLPEGLSRCHSGVHSDLCWDDPGELLTLRHLECVAEKLSPGWPLDRGIAGHVVHTGCADLTGSFRGDYRVVAYSGGKDHESVEDDAFELVRHAERVFIPARSAVMAAPLLWGMDRSGVGRCVALLLIALDDSDDHHEAGHRRRVDDSLSGRALAVRAAIEPWYLLFEQHARLIESHMATHGELVHEVQGIFSAVTSAEAVPETLRSNVSARQRLLWEAYSQRADSRGVCADEISLDEIIRLLERTADGALDETVPVIWHIPKELLDPNSKKRRIVADSRVLEYRLRDFLESSRANLENLLDLDAEERKILVGLSRFVGVDRGEETERLHISIRHRITPGVAAFIAEHAPEMGQRYLTTIEREVVRNRYVRRVRTHFGLYYLGVLLRGCGGDFLPPIMSEDRREVEWTMALRMPKGDLLSK